MAISSSRTNLYVFTVSTVTVRWCDLLTLVMIFVYQLTPEVVTQVSGMDEGGRWEIIQ